MRLNAGKILGISVTTNSKKEILEYLQKYLEERPKSKAQHSKFEQKPLVIVTPNPEQIVYAQEDSHFAQILNQADIAIPDGIGIAFAAKILGIGTSAGKLERIAGVDLMEDLVQEAAHWGFPVALIGGRAGLAVEALECLQRKYSGLRGWAMEPGEVLVSNLGNLSNLSYLSEKIRKTNTRIVFVGLGAPKQEYFIEELVRYWLLVHRKTEKSQNDQRINEQTNNPLIFMSVGGSFDIIAGRLPRAPLLLRALGLEWVWRLILEPWRIRRQFALVRFLFLVLRTKLSV